MPELESIFAKAVELQDPMQQRDFLDSACQQDTLLRNRVGALIDANRKAAFFMQEPAGIVELDEFDNVEPPIGEQPGDKIGRYQLTEQIGEGGMGTVFRAKQIYPVERTVALKVIKPGLDTKEVVARFESERQALALMDHPNIARALDAGATPLGRPYFVMEHVEGQSISEYCNEQQLTTRKRLELFLPVCEAIQHAHHKGVIHRDIKPHNVLVTSAARIPEPKVIDFGIAKAIEMQLTNKTLQTRPGQFIGTPAYMSPEQADSTSAAIDTRSDVYSLGATLYELLAGVAPFDGAKLKTKTNEEICRVIREETPITPSAAISTNKGAAATQVATARRATPRELKSAVSGDLDWIVMRSLEKDPDDRYATAAALADDVRRYLNNEVVVARPPSVSYRLKKLVSRNRLAVATAAIVATALLISTCVSGYFAYWALNSLALANEQTEVAQEQKAALSDYVTFLNNDVFAQANLAEEPNRNVTLRFILDRAAQSLATRGKLQPEVEAAVRTTIGQTYRSLGEYDQSLHHLRRVCDLNKIQFGPKSVQTSRSSIELAETLLSLAKFDEAKSLLNSALVIAKQHQDTELQLAAMQLLAAHSEATGNLPAAESLLSKVLETRKRNLGSNDPRTSQAMADLAYVYQSQGRHAEATTTLKKAIQGLSPDPLHPSRLKAAVRLARLYTLRGEVDAAEELYAKTVDHLSSLAGASHPQTMTAKHGWALAQASLGRLPQAQRLLTEVLNTQRAQLGDEHPSTLSTMHNLARLHARIGNTSEAKQLFEQQICGHLKTHGAQHNATREALSALAFFYMDQAKFAEAIPIYQQLTASFVAEDGLIDRRSISSRSMLALCCAKSDDTSQAKMVLEAALLDCKQELPNDWLCPVIEGQLGEVLMTLGERTAAELALVRSYEQLKEQEINLPLRWRPLGLRAATRRLADFYESDTSSQQQKRAHDYRQEYEHICKFGSIQNVEQVEDLGNGDTN